MELDLPTPNLLNNPTDAKYLAELNTVLVATIQEAKDRISQLEFIFCSRLFPAFQSRSKALTEALESSRAEWRARESSLLRQIDDVRAEKDELARMNERNEGVAGELKERLAAEAAERKEMAESMLRQLDSKEGELAAERSKRRRLLEGWKEMGERYKHVKSQYRFLLRRSGLVEGEGRVSSPSPGADKENNQCEYIFLESELS